MEGIVQPRPGLQMRPQPQPIPAPGPPTELLLSWWPTETVRHHVSSLLGLLQQNITDWMTNYRHLFLRFWRLEDQVQGRVWFLLTAHSLNTDDCCLARSSPGLSCIHTIPGVSSFLQKPQVYWIRGPPLQHHLTLITSLKVLSLNKKLVGVRVNIWTGEQGEIIQSITY